MTKGISYYSWKIQGKSLSFFAHSLQHCHFMTDIQNQDEPKLIKHVVQAHETLSSIALKYNMTVNIEFVNEVTKYLFYSFFSGARVKSIKWAQ